MLGSFGACASIVECKLETGRTHQIRVHMAHIKHPVVGDPLYGLQKTGVGGYLKRAMIPPEKAAFITAFPRQALHAVALAFDHPVTSKPMKFEVDLPNDIKDLIKNFAD